MSEAYQAWLLAFGAEVYARREALGMNQRALGVMAGASEGTISNIERGLVRPNTRTVWDIREALGLSNGDAVAENAVVP